jgi:hypothetical protein
MKNKVKPLCLIFTQYVRGVSEKFICTVNRYNTTVFKTRHNLRSSLVRTRPITALQTDHWTMTLRTQAKFRLSRAISEEDHNIVWNQAKILQLDENCRYRKYKEAAHMMAC